MSFTKPHQPRKRFGQHFLTDALVIEQIVQAIHPQLQDNLVEIGPGQGALTVPLLQHCQRLTVVELDRDLVAQLPRLVKQPDKLQIITADALKFDFSQLAAPTLRIVGNLPYNISTPLLFHLLDFGDCITDMLFMLQKEVVDRMVATVGSKQYGRLSIMLQYGFQIEKLFDVPPTAFKPPPKVESSIVCLVPYSQRPVVAQDVQVLQQVVAQAFMQRRKTLRNTLKGLLTAVEIEAVGIDPQQRAEMLSIAEFVRLADYLAEKIK